MIHSFKIVEHVNKNITVQFYQDNKLRKIIFTNGTKALEHFIGIQRYYVNTASGIATNDEIIQGTIENMRKRYIFKANANNPSIFRPIAKSLILS